MSFVAAMTTATEVAAAQAAAATAAQIAAANAAATAAATTATSGLGAAAAQQAAAQAAMTGAGGISAAAPTAAMTTAAPTAAMTTAAPTATGGIQGVNLANVAGNTMTDAGSSLLGPSGGPLALPPAPAAPMSTAAVPEVAPAAAPAATPLPPAGVEQITNPNIPTWANQGTQGPGIKLTQAPLSVDSVQYNPYSIGSQIPADAYNLQTGAQGLSGINGATATQPSALERGFSKVMGLAKDYPIPAMYAASTFVNALSQDEEEKKKPNALGKYKLSSNFQGSQPTSNVYRPQYQTFAQGGIAALAGGGYPMGMQDSTQYATPSQMPMSAEVINADYEPMGMGFSAGGAPVLKMGQGIVSEEDPDFAFTSPYKTAAGKLDKLYKKTHMSQRSMATAPELGAIDLTPAMMKKAAQGGIMGADSSLGGYAAGGNARLLRGPGDGMSDDIPATIANKQPARLADGEFVIPADVVSHLGNGSTEAGAKQLHGMMDKVRKARTGRKAQGKQINAAKYIPKK